MMRTAALLALLAVPLAAERFRMPQSGDAVAEVEMEAPGQNGRTIPVVVDGAEQQHLTLFAGGDRFVYRIFLAGVPAGEHTVEVGGRVHPVSIRVHPNNSPELTHAPVLYARKNTIGRFTDVPMLCYSERLSENGRAYLQYTVIFSNEDGGTSTRGLMARWGRTTDIEYIYRVFLDTDEATIQAKDHKEVPFRGKRVGRHPFLIPSTDNNMVSDEGMSPIRYQMAPLAADLSRHSREELMDQHPLTYRVAAEELERENKLRPFGEVDGEKVSDPRNYLYLEAKVDNQQAAIAAVVRLKGDPRWFTSNLGRADYALERSGWARTTVELPLGTQAAQIGEIGFQCVLQQKVIAGLCRVEEVSKAFLLDREYRPEPSFWALTTSVELPSGRIWTSPLK